MLGSPLTLLAHRSNYRLFRADVDPKWEHPANAKGGRWSVTVSSQSGRKQFLDKAWLYAVLAVIGERLDSDNQVRLAFCVALSRSG